jgi:hypothetical protein
MHPTATNAATTRRVMMVTTEMFADAMTQRGNLHFCHWSYIHLAASKHVCSRRVVFSLVLLGNVVT